METPTQDIRSQKILSGITNLLTELKIDLVANILEINDSIESKLNLQQLKRIQRTTDQYVRRTSNLFYIGFLGHFSSGKSSTINSLLQIKGTKYERRSTNNPTDDQITLLTNLNNNDDVIKLIRSGDVPVIISLIENNEFLKDKVIMDTPGSGDPSTFEEIVRDSLPLCDVIVYCLSATQPLTNSDIPLLKEKEKNLKNIPTIYLITRGTEFKYNSLQLLSESNFDKLKYKTFASELASRMNTVVDSINLNFDDFIVIDNSENFNLDKFSNKLLGFCNPLNYGTILKLHDYKIDYFIRTLKEVKMFFSSLVTDKLAIVDEYFSQAKINIQKYDEKTKIGTDKMINSWRSIDDKIKQAIDGSITQNNNVAALLVTPLNLNETDIAKLWRSKNFELLNGKNFSVIYNLSKSIEYKLIDIKGRLEQKLFLLPKNGVFSIEEVQEYLKEELSNKLHEEINIKYDCLKLYNEYNKEIFEYLVDTKLLSLKRQLESLKSRVKSINPLETIEKNIEDAKRVILEIFQTYKDGVNIYTVAAFSREAKNYIRKLGLSEELDKVDTEIPNIEKSIETTEEKIFSAYYTARQNFQDQCSSIGIDLHTLTINQPAFIVYEKEKDILAEQEIIKESGKEKIRNIITYFSDRVSDYFLNKIRTINSSLLSLSVAKEKELAEIKKKRIKYYASRYLPTLGLMTASVIFFFVFPGQKISDNLSIGWQWVLGIFVNACSGIINTIVNIKKDKYNIYKMEITKRFTENEKELIAKKFIEDFDSFAKTAVDQLQEEIRVKIRLQVTDVLDIATSIKFNIHNHATHKELIQYEERLKKNITSYSKSLSYLKNTTTMILNDTLKNRDVLLTESELIKNNSLQPSFNLLSNTRQNIKNVKNKIETIEFS